MEESRKMIHPKKLAEFTLLLENGLSQKEIQELFKITNKQYQEFLDELSMIRQTMIPLMVSEGLIDNYIYQKRRLKYQKKWVVEKRWEIMAMKDNEAFNELFWEDMRLDQVEIKLACDEIEIDYIRKLSTDVPIVVSESIHLIISTSNDMVILCFIRQSILKCD